jgi:hypothetical protein
VSLFLEAAPHIFAVGDALWPESAKRHGSVREATDWLGGVLGFAKAAGADLTASN